MTNLYKAIIFDLDGTAIPNDAIGKPSLRVINAVQKAKNSLYLCCATGRAISNAKYIIDDLKLVSPCVISGGTQIYDPISEKIIWKKIIENSDVKEILSICNDMQYELMFNETLMGEYKERFVPDVVNVAYYMQVPEEKALQVVQQLNKIETLEVILAGSWKEGCKDIHITNKYATKEHATNGLLKILNLDKSEVIGIGDADNDIHLFKAVGYKVAMGNATENLKALADKVIKPVDEDGLAEFILSLV